jgi:hypothetical protein
MKVRRLEEEEDIIGNLVKKNVFILEERMRDKAYRAQGKKENVIRAGVKRDFVLC